MEGKEKVEDGRGRGGERKEGMPLQRQLLDPPMSVIGDIVRATCFVHSVHSDFQTFRNQKPLNPSILNLTLLRSTVTFWRCAAK